MFLLAVMGMMLFAVTEGAFAWVIKPLMNDAFVAQDSLAIKWIPFVIIGIFALRIIGGFLSTYCMAWVSRSVIRDLRQQMFDQLLRLPANYYDRHSSGGLLSRMVYDVEQLAEASSGVITILIRDSLTILVLLGVLLHHSVALTVILFASTPILAGLVVLVAKRFRKLSHRIQQSMGDVSSVTEETIEAHREIKIFGGQSYETRQFDSINKYNRRQFLKLAATNALSSPVIQFIVAIALAFIIFLATQEKMDPGEFASYLTAMLLLMQSAKRLTSLNATLQRGIAASQSVFKFLDQEVELDTGTHILASSKGDVRFENVCFQYTRQGGAVLQDVSFSAQVGQTVAFVGRSGAGKTSLVSLLPRFYELTSGKIYLDGHDIQTLTLASLRSQISLVSQHVTLFNDTIAHNIAYGALEQASEEDIKRAAEAAHAFEFIEKFPDGFDTMVGENGLLLSGGQRQRLAIARAILKNAPLLILDEATSALDTESERNIQQALETLMQNRTTLVIAHRLSTIENADNIVVMDQGRIVEEGTHAALISKAGQYAALHQLQFSDKS